MYWSFLIVPIFSKQLEPENHMKGLPQPNSRSNPQYRQK